jgi:hypothetical protein
MEFTFVGRVIEWRGYLLPLKDAVRKPQQIAVGDEVAVE